MYDANVTVSFELPESVYNEVARFAHESKLSIPSAAAKLILRGLTSLDGQNTFEIDALTHLPVVSVGRPISSDEAQRLLEEDE